MLAVCGFGFSLRCRHAPLGRARLRNVMAKAILKPNIKRDLLAGSTPAPVFTLQLSVVEKERARLLFISQLVSSIGPTVLVGLSTGPGPYYTHMSL
ncbi:hypothetical protein AUC43_08990 [Hymenobacter sedentarius]|uniref:Uncharacterized protein n=1 Tax=Hymenobacter sedentarius TaxID=1411621 RepID=A0A0U4C2E7_9BACT|nr:hypothetical protein AUC43_08990 [Hymenobacter sedentarius]